MQETKQKNAESPENITVNENAAPPANGSSAETRPKAKDTIRTERRIAKAQSEIAESVKRANINAGAKKAELLYGQEYRKKLMQENARQLQEKRRQEDALAKAKREEEMRLRKEEILRAHESEQEQLSKRTSESDKLINEIKKRRDAEALARQNANRERETAAQAPALATHAPVQPTPAPAAPAEEKWEKITVDIERTQIGDSSNVLYIPAHGIHVPVRPIAPAPMPHMQMPGYDPRYAMESARFDAMNRELNERNEKLKGAMDEYLTKIKDADDANKAMYDEQIAKIKEAQEALYRERAEFNKAVELERQRREEELLRQREAGAIAAADAARVAAEPRVAPTSIPVPQEPIPEEELIKAALKKGISDEDAILEYEKYLRRKGEFDKYTLDIAAQEPQLSPNIEYSELSTPAPKASEDDTKIDEASLGITAKETVKRIKRIDKDIRKIEKREADVTGSAAQMLYNNRLELEKEALDLLSATLIASAEFKNKKQTRKFKKLLNLRVARYNLLIDDFIARTGMDVPKLSRSTAKNIIAGKPYQKPIPLVLRSVEMTNIPETPTVSEKELRRAQKEELHRAAIADKESKQLEKSLKKKGIGEAALDFDEKAELAELMQAISDQRSRDEAMVEQRYKYLSLKCRTDKELNQYTFGTRRKNNSDDVRHADGIAKKIKSLKRPAMKYEKLDNDRYYEIVALDTAKAVYKKKRADKIKLEAIKSRMNMLLEKRDIINKRLYTLYLGKDEGDKRDKETKYIEIRRRAVRKAYKKQLKLYKLMENEHLPLDMKEGIHKLMNEKIKLCGQAEELSARIRDAKGHSKKEMQRERARALRDIKRVTEDIEYYFNRKVNRRIEKNKTKRSQLVWLIVLLVILGGGFAVYYFFGAQIAEFFQSLFKGFLG